MQTPFSWIPDIDKQGHIWAGWALCLTASLVFGSVVSGIFVALGIAVLVWWGAA